MSSGVQGFWSRISVSPRLFRHVMNWWPPFLGMRIHIEEISPDWRHVRMRMKLGLRNRNYVGSHFGGALFTMTDPYFMIMMMHQLGSGYLVWDKSAKIDFIAPGRTTVYADFHLGEEQIAAARQGTAGGEKFLPTYAVDIVDTSGKVIARMEKTLYIRRKSEKPRSDA